MDPRSGTYFAPDTGPMNNQYMRIIARKALRDFWELHPDAQQALQARYADVKRADWESPADVKDIYHNASNATNSLVVLTSRATSTSPQRRAG